MTTPVQYRTNPLLVTGFDPFGQVRINPSGLLAKALDGEVVGGWRIVGSVLPVALDALVPEIDRLLLTHDPALVISFGVAESAEAFRLESKAYNLADFRIPDNDGRLVQGISLEAEGPAEVETSLAIGPLQAALKAEGFAVEISDDPGRYLCNASFYHFRRRCRAGFVHLPLLPNSLDAPPVSRSWPFLTQLAAALCLIETATKAPELS